MLRGHVAKSGHDRACVTGTFENSPKGRAVVATCEPVGALGWELAHCDTFAALAAEVTSRRRFSTPASTEALIDRMATRYGRRGSVGHRVAGALLARAATRDGELVNVLMNAGRGRGYYHGSPLGAGDPRYRLQTRAAEVYWHGARLVARDGAHRCLACGARETRARPHRLDGYCVTHRLLHGQEDRDRRAMRVVLRDAAEALGITVAGKQARRRTRA